MPLCWRGIALWPDALASILAEGVASKPELWVAAEELLVGDVIGSWAAADIRPGSPDPPDLLAERQILQSGGPSGLLRLFYVLNPTLPCRVQGMANRWIATIPDLMGFFETAAASAGDNLIDLHVAAFIAARADRKIQMQIGGLAAAKDAHAFRSAELALLRDMQARYHPAPMRALAKWVAARLQPDLKRWHNRPQREATQLRLDALANAGFLARLLELIADPATRALDNAGVQRAANEKARIDEELAAIDSSDKLRFADAERFGRAIAGGIGLSAFILMVMSVLL
jgi:eukaryotic-like serine/threonine-protein kinase